MATCSKICCQVIKSDYLSKEAYIKALETIDYGCFEWRQAAGCIADLLEEDAMRFENPATFQKTFEDTYRAYLLLKELLAGSQFPEHEQQLLKQIKMQVQLKA